MRAIQLFILAVLVFGNTIKAQENGSQSREGSSMVLPQVQIIPIEDSQRGRQYDLYVELPEEYSENTDKQYPVIYYTDAIWSIEMLSAASEFIIPNAILVGISWQKDMNPDLLNEVGAHVSRFRDYSVQSSSNEEHQAKYQFGQADDHLKFIRNNVFKYIEDNYRTSPENRTYFGYSLGGLFGAYALLKQPDTFKNYILGSPALRGDIPYFTSLNSEMENTNLNANVFISYGSLEDELGRYALEFITLLKKRKDSSLQLHHQVMEGSHQTAAPLTGIRGVSWLKGMINE